MLNNAPKLSLLKVAGDKAMRLVGVLVGWLALAAAYPALADEKFDPKEIRVITQTSATSKCIGDPRTPICAKETELACISRADRSLCSRVGFFPSEPLPPPENIKYKIINVYRIPAAQEMNVKKDVHWSKPYFVQIVFRRDNVHVNDCNGDDCFGMLLMSFYRPYDNEWRAFDWEYAD